MRVRLYLGSHAPLKDGRNAKYYPARFSKPLVEMLLRDYFDVDKYGSSIIFHEYPLAEFDEDSESMDPNMLIIRSMSIEDAARLLLLDEDFVRLGNINNGVLYEPVTLNSLMAWNASLISIIDYERAEDELERARSGEITDNLSDLRKDLDRKEVIYEIMLSLSSILRDAVMAKAIDKISKRNLADTALVIRGFAHEISLVPFLEVLGYEVEIEYDPENINHFNKGDFAFMTAVMDRILNSETDIKWPKSILSLLGLIGSDPRHFTNCLNNLNLNSRVSPDDFKDLVKWLYKNARDMKDEYDNPFLVTRSLLDRNGI